MEVLKRTDDVIQIGRKVLKKTVSDEIFIDSLSQRSFIFPVDLMILLYYHFSLVHTSRETLIGFIFVKKEYEGSVLATV